MEANWNKLVLDRPPTTSWRCSLNKFDTQGFLKSINKTIMELETQKMFQTEAAILSRLIYRMKSKLRSDKGLKNMEKVNRALLNYLKLSLENDYKYLKDNTDREGDIQVLPSRQMLQYVLVRTQGFAKLMCRIENVSKCAGDFFGDRISLGQAWNVSIIAYAVVSRIWLLSRYLTKKCCDWYSRMYKYLHKLTIIGISWRPENYQFPENLKIWLSVPWIDEEIKKLPEKESLTDSIFNLITRDTESEEDLESDLHETNVVSAAQSKETAKNLVLSSEIDQPDPPVMETGERICREATDFTRLTTKTPTSKKRKNIEVSDNDELVGIPSKIGKQLINTKQMKSKVFSVDDLERKEDVVKLLSLETYPGLDKLQWKIIRNNVNKVLVKLNKRNSSKKNQDLALKRVIEALRDWIN